MSGAEQGNQRPVHDEGDLHRARHAERTIEEVVRDNGHEQSKDSSKHRRPGTPSQPTDGEGKQRPGPGGPQPGAHILQPEHSLPRGLRERSVRRAEDVAHRAERSESRAGDHCDPPGAKIPSVAVGGERVKGVDCPSPFIARVVSGFQHMPVEASLAASARRIGGHSPVPYDVMPGSCVSGAVTQETLDRGLHRGPGGRRAGAPSTRRRNVRRGIPRRRSGTSDGYGDARMPGSSSARRIIRHRAGPGTGTVRAPSQPAELGPVEDRLWDRDRPRTSMASRYALCSSTPSVCHHAPNSSAAARVCSMTRSSVRKRSQGWPTRRAKRSG